MISDFDSNGDAELFKIRKVQRPLVAATPMPLFKAPLYVSFGILSGPVIDACEMGDGLATPAAHARQPYVLDLMAARAEGYQTLQLLDAACIIIREDLVAFDGPAAALPAADFADPARTPEGVSLEPLPFIP
jgi:hypothetical protein